MNSNQFETQCLQIVSETGLANPGDVTDISGLAGGVSSDIAVVSIGAKKFCVKVSLMQLRVSETWKAPVHRNASEYAWLSFVSGLIPTAVPKLYGQSTTGNGFVMEFCNPETHKNWKSELMAGRVDEKFASQVGKVLGRIHHHSTEAELDFSNQDDFKALRLEPYFLFTASKHPALKVEFKEVSEQLYSSPIALVHGDVSPKNILQGPNGPVFLDAECAVMSEPSFDVAFCLNHLLIKMLMGIADQDALRRSILGLWESYRQHVAWESAEAEEERVCRLIPLMLLARVDGKSPVEYHTESSPEQLRTVAFSIIESRPRTLQTLLNQLNEGAIEKS